MDAIVRRRPPNDGWRHARVSAKAGMTALGVALPLATLIGLPLDNPHLILNHRMFAKTLYRRALAGQTNCGLLSVRLKFQYLWLAS